jgi:hypothetical protein
MTLYREARVSDPVLNEALKGRSVRLQDAEKLEKIAHSPEGLVARETVRAVSHGDEMGLSEGAAAQQ